jgi:hypothetical protein
MVHYDLFGKKYSKMTNVYIARHIAKPLPDFS